MKFEKGEKVMAFYRNPKDEDDEEWAKATIVKVDAKKRTYTVKWGDGTKNDLVKKEKDVKPMKATKTATKATKKTTVKKAAKKAPAKKAAKPAAKDWAVKRVKDELRTAARWILSEIGA
jgi:hypothetical protein